MDSTPVAYRFFTLYLDNLPLPRLVSEPNMAVLLAVAIVAAVVIYLLAAITWPERF